ncbi:MAG: DUF2971 domain-containing protein [Pelagibacterium sp.]|uniref:DUF2971 domain-containing protein n=1 Tax=Pelagibacterium sp. TaxID=1967288 RepID=UPI0032EB9986
MNIDEELPELPANWTSTRRYFFKYMRREVAEIVLTNGTLRWSTPATLNDPYDVQFHLGAIDLTEQTIALATERLWQVYNGDIPPQPTDTPFAAMIRGLRSVTDLPKEEFLAEFSPAIKEGFENMLRALPALNAEVASLMADSKLLCLTGTPTNTAMWTHYAEQGQGVVLCLQSMPAIDSPYGMARKVNYVDEVPAWLDEKLLVDMASGLTHLEPAHAMNMLITTKGIDWAYEREWRVSSGAGRNPDAPHEDIPFHKSELAGVIFGPLTPPEDQARLASIAERYPEAKLYTAAKLPGSLRHQILPL